MLQFADCCGFLSSCTLPLSSIGLCWVCSLLNQTCDLDSSHGSVCSMVVFTKLHGWDSTSSNMCIAPRPKKITLPTQVLGTDGVWDVMTNAEVVAFVEDYRSAPHAAMSAADALSWEAQQRWKAVGGAGALRRRHKQMMPRESHAALPTAGWSCP